MGVVCGHPRWVSAGPQRVRCAGHALPYREASAANTLQLHVGVAKPELSASHLPGVPSAAHGTLAVPPPLQSGTPPLHPSRITHHSRVPHPIPPAGARCRVAVAPATHGHDVAWCAQHTVRRRTAHCTTHAERLGAHSGGPAHTQPRAACARIVRYSHLVPPCTPNTPCARTRQHTSRQHGCTHTHF